MNKTCCPQYTIKCQALDFKLSKSHKKAIKRVNNFLNYGKKPSEQENADSNESIGEECREMTVKEPVNIDDTPVLVNNEEMETADHEKQTTLSDQVNTLDKCPDPKPQTPKDINAKQSNLASTSQKKMPKPGG